MSESETEADDIEPATDDAPTDVPGVPSRLLNMMSPEMRNVIGIMRQENGIAKMMLRPMYPVSEDGEDAVISQADVVADIFNVLRLDTKRIAEAAGVDVEVSRMTPQRAALLIQDLVKGESLDLMEEFNRIEEKREQILRELAGDDAVEAHRDVKFSASYTNPDPEEVEDAG